jgi:hypothetical protein
MSRHPIILPSVLTCIGQALEISTFEELISWKVKDRVLLYTNNAGNALYCLTATAKKTSRARFDQAVEANSAQVKKAMSIYERWHDFEAVSGSLATQPRGIWLTLKRAITIIYRSDKWTGQEYDYIHDFITPPVCRVNRKTRPTLLALTGGKIRVTAEGIKG